MTTTPITTNGPTITVSSTADLADAYQLLSKQAGGGTILLEAGSYGYWSPSIYGQADGTEPVIIKSANPDDPARFTSMLLREVSNIRIESVAFDSTGVSPGDGSFDVWAQQVDTVQIVNSIFTFDADNTLKDGGLIGDKAVLFRDSSNILFENNYVDGYHHALEVTNVINADIIGNEITNFSGDGFRGGGLRDVTIADNYIYDPYSIDQFIDHTDLIQVWGAGSYILTENLTISNNTLIATDAASQSIFVRNEEFGKPGDSTAGHYKNITITDNLIYNAHTHGIHVSDANGVLIDNNTVLWNQDATKSMSGVPLEGEPSINLRSTVLNATVTDNITPKISVPDGTTLSGNQIVTYDSPNDPAYVGNHFLNPFAGAAVTPGDLAMLTSSPWAGLYGSSIGNSAVDFSGGVRAVLQTSVSETDNYQVIFDARNSEDANGAVSEADGYSFHWTFSDGTTAEGPVVGRLYDAGGFEGVDLEIRLNGEVVAAISRNVVIETKDIFAFDFESGAVDLSDNVSEVIDKGQTTSSQDGTGFLIGDGNKLELGRSTDNLFSADSFGLSLDLTPTGDERSGVFLHLHQTMTGRITDDGSFQFSLITDRGTYNLMSREPIFDDGQTHRIGVSFDGNSGKLELFSDGESVSSTQAWGTTAPPVYWNLVFGNTWNDSMDAIIDNVEMSLDPAVGSALAMTPRDAPASAVILSDVVVPDPPASQDAPGDDSSANGAGGIFDTPIEPSVASGSQTVDPGPETKTAPTGGDPSPEAPAPAEEPTTSAEPEATGTGGGRSPEAPPEPAPAGGDDDDDEGGFFLIRILKALFSIFSRGGDDDDEASAAPAGADEGPTLDEIVPVTGVLDETLPEQMDDDDPAFDLVA